MCTAGLKKRNSSGIEVGSSLRELVMGKDMKIKLLVSVGTLMLCVMIILLSLPSNTFATPRLRYACNSDICAPERERYRKRAMGMACSAARRLSRLIAQLDRKRRDLQATEARLQRCLLNPRTNYSGCPYLVTRVLGLRVLIMSLQAQINALRRQLTASCNSSFPVPGRRRNPTQCEQDEASKYCPIGSVAQALISVSQRCTDLRIEEGNALLNCNPQCINPPNLAFVIESDPPLAALVGDLPECGATETPTPIATTGPTAVPSAVPTALPTVEATPVASPIPTAII